MASRSTLLRRCFDAAVSAAGAAAAVQRCVARDGTWLVLGDGRRYDLRQLRRIWLLGAGKAAAEMAAALVAVLGRSPDGGCVVVKDGHGVPVPGVELLEAAHPVPDARGVEASHRIAAIAAAAEADDLVIFCLTGGASALLAAPRAGLTLADEQAVTDLLLASGADIAAINTVRRHCSQLKGGGLLRLAAPAQVLTLAVSDVLGDDPAAIGSGPTVGDPSTFADAIACCRNAGIWQRLPAPVRALLEAGAAGHEAETLDPDDPLLARAHYLLVARNADALRAAASVAAAAGYHVEHEAEPLHGDAALAGQRLGRRLEALAAQPGRHCLIAGGETTVLLPPEHGRGGRNQQLALAAALELRSPRCSLLAAGTDGTDGPTDAAGAIVDAATCRRIADPTAALARCDAYPALRAADALLVTGPTGTNVMDVVIGVVGAGPEPDGPA